MSPTEAIEDGTALEDTTLPGVGKAAFSQGAKTQRTLANIADSLNDDLREKYLIVPHSDPKDICNTILKTHGLVPEAFDYVSNIEDIINSKINDISIDDNANKSEKTIEAIHQEAFASAKKAIGFDMLYRTMKELYGKDEAKRLSGEMYDYSLAISDSTAILKPYCYSIDASKLVTIGRDFGQLHSGPCKRVSSYTSALCETVHQLSSHLAGAIAIGSFFLDIAHILLYKENYDLNQIYDPTTRKYVENEMQQFVHSVNHLSRNSNESPFTNLSAFDRPKLKALISKDNMGWYFPELTEEEDAEKHSTIVKFLKQMDYSWEDYVVEYIMRVQRIFIDFFDKGDPLSNGMPYRFPVFTVNFSKVNGGIVDEEFLEYITNKDIYRYNIFVSHGTKVASCCRLLSDADMLDLASESNSFGGVGISLGSHRVMTVNFNRIALEVDTYTSYNTLLDKRIDDAAKILKAHKDLIQLTAKRGLQMFITNGWINMKRMFSTFGILGLVEAAETMERQCGKYDGDFVGDMLTRMNDRVLEAGKKYKILGNIEQIPAESMAVRLAKIDQLLFDESRVPYKMYANQFIPLWNDATLWEKLAADGKYNKLITGGGIVHAQIGERVTPEQAREIINYAIEAGCEHFALNAVYSQCDNNHTTFGKITKCPVCGSENVDYLTRVVGFFTRVSNWNKTRREWEFPKRTFVSIEDVNA
jgi:ribonucleoside-triphosphate reductase